MNTSARDLRRLGVVSLLVRRPIIFGCLWVCTQLTLHGNFFDFGCVSAMLMNKHIRKRLNTLWNFELLSASSQLEAEPHNTYGHSQVSKTGG